MPESPRRESASELTSWRSNNILPKWTQERIRWLIHNAKEDIDLLDHEIVRVTQHLADLTRQRNDETARIESLQIAISPFKIVPPEIISQILVFCSHEPVVIPSRRRDEHPWNVSQVCAQWRQIALREPRLWANIKIRSTMTQTQGANHAESGIDLLARDHFIRETLRNILSRPTMPISLTVSGREVEMMGDLINMFNQRFKHLSLRPRDHKPLVTLARLPPHSFSQLESLDLRGAATNPLTLPFKGPTTLPFESAMALQRVTISGSFIPEMLQMPFAQLTSFQAIGLPLKKSLAYSIIEKGTFLEDLSIFILGNGPHPPDDIILSKNLHSLHIESLDEGDWGIFLQRLKCPSLQNLSLTVPTYEERTNSSLSALSAFISRSSCSITAFHITGDPRKRVIQPSDAVFESLLRLLPSLTDFTSCFITPPIVFDMLSSGLLPMLKTCSWRVKMSGLYAALKLFEFHICQAQFKESQRALDICLRCDDDDPEFHRVLLRVQSKILEYRTLSSMYLTIGRYNEFLVSTRPLC